MSRANLAFIVGGASTFLNAIYLAIVAVIDPTSSSGVLITIAVINGINTGLASLAVYLRGGPVAGEAAYLERIRVLEALVVRLRQSQLDPLPKDDFVIGE